MKLTAFSHLIFFFISFIFSPFLLNAQEVEGTQLEILHYHHSLGHQGLQFEGRTSIIKGLQYNEGRRSIHQGQSFRVGTRIGGDIRLQIRLDDYQNLEYFGEVNLVELLETFYQFRQNESQTRDSLSLSLGQLKLQRNDQWSFLEEGIYFKLVSYQMEFGGSPLSYCGRIDFLGVNLGLKDRSSIGQRKLDHLIEIVDSDLCAQIDGTPIKIKITAGFKLIRSMENLEDKPLAELNRWKGVLSFIYNDYSLGAQYFYDQIEYSDETDENGHLIIIFLNSQL